MYVAQVSQREGLGAQQAPWIWSINVAFTRALHSEPNNFCMVIGKVAKEARIAHRRDSDPLVRPNGKLVGRHNVEVCH